MGAVSLSTSLNAQNVRVNVVGGLNAGNVTASGGGLSISTTIQPSFFGGVGVQFAVPSISNNFFIQVDALYANNRSKVDGNAIHEEFQESNKIILHELQLPVYVKYRVSQTFSLKLNAGFFVGYTFPDEGEFSDGRFNAGLVGGLEYDFTDKFFVLGRYNWGLVNLSQEIEGVKFKTHSFQLGVGYRF